MKLYSNLSDEKLVDLIAMNDNKAVEALLYRYKNQVFRYIMKLVNNDEQLANDIFQETFIKVIVNLKQSRYKDSGNIINWMNRIAYNLVIDYHRRSNSDKFISKDDEEVDVLNTFTQYDISAQEALEREEAYNSIERLVSMLPDDQQRIVRLFYYENKQFNEIAQIEGISINTALGRMRYAKLNMRKNAVKYNIIRDSSILGE